MAIIESAWSNEVSGVVAGHDLYVLDTFQGNNEPIGWRDPDVHPEGSAWEVNNGSFYADNGLLIGLNNTTHDKAWIESENTDVLIRCMFKFLDSSDSAHFNLMARVQAASSHYFMRVLPTSIRISRTANTTLVSRAATLSVDTWYTAEFALNGDTLYANVSDGGDPISVVDTTYQSETKHGVYYFRGQQMVADFFEVGPFQEI